MFVLVPVGVSLDLLSEKSTCPDAENLLYIRTTTLCSLPFRALSHSLRVPEQLFAAALQVEQGNYLGMVSIRDVVRCHNINMLFCSRAYPLNMSPESLFAG